MLFILVFRFAAHEVRVVECLVDAGANVNAMNHRRDTALNLAAFWGRVRLVKLRLVVLVVVMVMVLLVLVLLWVLVMVIALLVLVLVSVLVVLVVMVVVVCCC